MMGESKSQIGGDDSSTRADPISESPVRTEKSTSKPTSLEGDAEPEQAEDHSVSSFKYYLRALSYHDALGWTLNVIAVFGMIVSGAIIPLMNVIFGKFINIFNDFVNGKLSPEEYRHKVGDFALYFVYLFIGKFVFVYLWSVLISITGIRAVKALRVDFIKQTLRQEIAFFDAPTSSIASQVTANGNIINSGISEKLGIIIQALSTFFTAFIVAFVFQWKLTLIVCCIVPLNIAFTVVGVTVDTKYEYRMYEHYSKSNALAEEVFSTIRTAHAYWAFPKLSKRFSDIMAEAQKIGLKKTLLYVLVLPADVFFPYSGYALALWQGIRMYTSGEVNDPGSVITVIFAMILASQALTLIAPQAIAVAKASAAAQDLFTVIDRKSAVDSLADHGATICECQGAVQLRNVNFAYPSRPDVPVLEDLSLDIPANKTTALVGASGSGKSTIVGLLERWYSVNSGDVTIDGHRVESLKLSWLRTIVRLVQQEPTLFSGTIYQNVVDGLTGTTMSDLTDDEKRKLVHEACRAAFAHDFIQQLPKGYDTYIGERGASLSGGQKQRIVIARSIISNPKILLLDEATSALDPHAEAVVQKALQNVAKSRTTLVIAHRLSTIREADNIIVMSKGKVVEQGTHDQLIAQQGNYAKLVASQDLGKKMDSIEAVKATDIRTSDASDIAEAQPALVEDDNIEAAIDSSVSHGLLAGLFLILKEQRPIWIPMFFNIVCAIVAGITYPALAVLFSRTLQAFEDVDKEKGQFFALMFFVAAITNGIAYGVSGWATNVIAQHMMKTYRCETFESTMRQDMRFFDRTENSAGALTSRVATESASLQELLSFNIFLIMVNIVNLVATIVLAIAYGWKLGLVLVFGGLPVLVLSGYVRIRLEFKFDEDAAERFAQSCGLAAEAVRGIRTVSSLALENTIIARYQASLQHIANDAVFSLSWKMAFYASSQSLSLLVMGLGFWYGGQLVSTGEYTTLQFYTVFLAIIFCGEAVAMIFQFITSFSKARIAMNYIFTLRKNRVFFESPDVPSSIESMDEKATADVSQGKDIAFDDVSFAYALRPDAKVLEGIDMAIRPGKMVALVGASGCGKSTMIALIQRYYDPISGEVRADGRDLKKLDCCLYRRDIALVQQEPVLYHGSIRDNLSLGIEQGEPTQEQVVEACKQANIWDFISSLPDGLATSCGSQGLSLSGGQRQRIAIARALIRQPRLLLLDEATSALDTESEKIVKEALDRAAAGRTTVAVAHRLSTIRDADTIVVFEQGRIVESGTHDELVAKKGTYYEMVLGQSLDREAASN